MSRAWLWGVVIAVSASAMGFFLRGRTPTVVTAQPVASPEVNASLRGEVADLRREIRSLERGLVTLPQPGAPAARNEPPSREDNVGPPDHETQRAAQKERAARLKQQMDLALQSQIRDRGMSVEVDRQLAALYASPGFEGTNVDHVDCGTTICRIKSRHDSQEVRGAFVRQAASHPPFDAEVFYTYGEDEPPTTTLYVARAGNRLPR